MDKRAQEQALGSYPYPQCPPGMHTYLPAYFDSSLSAHFGPILAVLLSLSPPYQFAQTRIPAGADDIPQCEHLRPLRRTFLVTAVVDSRPYTPKKHVFGILHSHPSQPRDHPRPLRRPFLVTAVVDSSHIHQNHVFGYFKLQHPELSANARTALAGLSTSSAPMSRGHIGQKLVF
ncbi:hypothetical protein B0H10DRAFT_2443224 [Mycena sp. CBHHK59/15]|nr:hypothetical protein B0H10DRAFT_2443224 [Mycena sp. CBHHK59/15]